MITAEQVWISGRIVEGCLLVALLVGLVVVRKIGKDEASRNRRGLRAVEAELKASIAKADGRAAEALELGHVVDVGLAGVKPRLDELSRKVEELHEAVGNCATRDDIARVMGRLEMVGLAVAKVGAGHGGGAAAS